MELRRKIIHCLGGITHGEAESMKRLAFYDGVSMAFKELKKEAESLNGQPSDEWCKKMYNYISECVERNGEILKEVIFFRNNRKGKDVDCDITNKGKDKHDRED